MANQLRDRDTRQKDMVKITRDNLLTDVGIITKLLNGKSLASSVNQPSLQFQTGDRMPRRKTTTTKPLPQESHLLLEELAETMESRQQSCGLTVIRRFLLQTTSPADVPLIVALSQQSKWRAI